MLTRTSVEFCAGAGGQALGLEQAGFNHKLLVDNDADCVRTLSHNRPNWRAICADMNGFVLPEVGPVDLFSGGLPCPPFSIAGKQLGERDERNLFPAALSLIEQLQPKFVLIENVRGFLSRSFGDYRDALRASFSGLGYSVDWRLYNAADFGVPQSRSRVTIVAARHELWPFFDFPAPVGVNHVSVADAIGDLLGSEGWEGIETWRRQATAVAPTIVGGSKKHGGPDLGPTRARAAWKKMGVNGGSIAPHPPERGFEGLPRLTNRMVARLQGFPDDWHFTGSKTAAYRQIGNAFPPPVARAIGLAIMEALTESELASRVPKTVAAE